jgi:branched-chain amino acid transport system ATP-binding protein
MTAMLRIDDLHVSYGRINAVQGLTLEVRENELVGLIGHNGAGKSTTVKAITGQLNPSRGTIEFEGRSIKGCKSDEILRRGISLVPEGRRIFSRLSVGENLRIGTSARRDRAEARADVRAMTERFEVLGRYFDRPAGLLSGGEQQQLAIARALLSRPRLLILDEPTLGLAPLIVDQVFDLLAELKDEGVTILLIEQNAARTIEIADRFYVLRAGGRIDFEGTSEAAKDAEEFQAHYLGFSKP